MTVWKEKDRAAWRYKFYYKGQVYQGSTGQLTREDAEEFEEQEKRKVRRRAHGLSTLAEHSPHITEFAATYYEYIRKRGKVRRLDRVDDLLRVVLRFWGRRPSGRDPKNPPIEGEPYHDLRMADPILDPSWITKFEQWMDARRVGTGKGPKRAVSPQTRNHYISIMSRLYKTAMRPQFAKKTGVTENPFAKVERYSVRTKRVAVTADELRRWLQHAPRHAQIAIAIAALAPKLRLQNVLGLRWDTSFDPAFTFITVPEHKTVGLTQQPLVVPISRQLRAFLQVLQRDRRRDQAYVVTYRGKPIKEIRGSVRAGAEAADLTYGLLKGGVTFHTIRHTAATLLAEVPYLTEAQRAATMGQDILTTQGYTHMRPHTQRPVLEELGQVLNLDEILTAAFGKPGQEPGVLASDTSKIPQEIEGSLDGAETDLT
ncbi:MAG TPA: tyrosine-type recombinase/integrase [Vicinamibacterales bacterium]|nr:tyrosine-type recombinase/integrase [Vicinamibacterales bacterium]